MKKVHLWGIIVLLVGLLAACSTNDAPEIDVNDTLVDEAANDFRISYNDGYDLTDPAELSRLVKDYPEFSSVSESLAAEAADIRAEAETNGLETQTYDAYCNSSVGLYKFYASHIDNYKFKSKYKINCNYKWYAVKVYSTIKNDHYYNKYVAYHAYGAWVYSKHYDWFNDSNRPDVVCAYGYGGVFDYHGRFYSVAPKKHCVNFRDKFNPTPTNDAPTVDAGDDTKITLPTTTTTLNGSASDDGRPNGRLTVKWKQVSGPANATISNPNSLNTSVSFPAVAGDYHFRLTASDGALSSSDTVDITVSPAPAPTNDAPNVDAGDAAKITLPETSYILSGSASDDGQPNGQLTTTWTQVSGPANTSIVSPDSLSTKVDFPTTPGDYTFRLTASDGALSSSDTVVITVSPATPEPGNDAPTVDAGDAAKITLPETSYILRGSASDDGQPNGQLTTTWTQVSGPANTSIVSPDSVNTKVDFPTTPGDYTFRLTANDGALSSSDTVVITVSPATPAPTNNAPTVDAGDAAKITLPETSYILSGSASDDGQPNGQLSTNWTQVSGPGNASIVSPDSLNTKVDFPTTAGDYTFRLTASDGDLSSSDTVVITVSPATPEPGNDPPKVNAGEDRTITLPTTTIVITGTASDDGRPDGQLTTLWTQVSGPATASFVSAESATTQFNFPPVPGTYTFRLTASDGSLSSSDTVVITVLPDPKN